MLKVHEKVGCMSLVSVHAVRKIDECDYETLVYEVRLDGGARIAATAKHIFLVVREGKEVFLSANQLQKGDDFWLDTGMWAADGSLQFEKPFRYLKRAPKEDP